MKVHVIQPYKKDGAWVFDDDRVGLVQEPFVSGIPEMMDDLVKDIPGSENGFNLFFSTEDFSGNQRTLQWLRSDGDGNWYRCLETNAEGWLCPALLKYFESPPKTIFVSASTLTACSVCAGTTRKFVIFCSVMLDCLTDGAEFDAEPYFNQASYEDIKAIMKVGWAVNETVDQVAKFARQDNPEVDRVLKRAESAPDYIDGLDHGYSTVLDIEDVETWLKKNRPEWFEKLEEENN